MPSHRSDVELLVLHGLRCIGSASEDRLATAIGLGSGEVSSALRALERRGLVSHIEGPFGGWALTDTGRAVGSERVAAELAAAGARPHIEAGLEGFMELNSRLLDACHDWQMQRVGGSSIPNDHRDPVYDARVIDRLVVIDRSVHSILDGLAATLARFGTYRTRLADALACVEAGRHAYFTDNLDSYHTVWFQLHEDLLVTLGIVRFAGS